MMRAESTAAAPPTGRFALFDQAPPTPSEAAASLYETFDAVRQAANTSTAAWTQHPTVREYAGVMFWSIRRLEYGFAADALAAIEASSDGPLDILDLGCGVVPLAEWAAQRGHRVVALDPLVDEVALVANAGSPYDNGVGYLAARGEALPFADASFDAVLCVSVLEHMVHGHDHMTLREIGRVLRPDGFLALTFDVGPTRPGNDARRNLDHPFDPAQAKALLATAATAFQLDTGALPPAVDSLDWNQVHDFWRRQAETDGRAGQDPRDYLAVGGLLRRRDDAAMPANADALRWQVEAATALYRQTAVARAEAAERLDVIEELEQAAKEREIRLDELHAAETDRQAREAALAASIEAERATLADRQALYEDLNRQLELATQRLIDLEVRQSTRISRTLPRRIARMIVGPVRSALRTRLGVLFQFPAQSLLLPPEYAATPVPTTQPKVSIVTPSFRQGQFIERTMLSVLDQSYPNIQYVVQDGGSDDETVSVLERHAERLAHWESAPDDGQTDAINKGFVHTDGEIMAWLNSDDTLLPGAVAYVVDYFNRHPEVDMVYGHRVIIDDEDREVGRWVLPPHSAKALKLADFVPQETLFWRRRVWDKVGGLDQDFHFAMDWDFLLRVQAAGCRIVRLPRFLACFRAHEAQKTVVEIGERGAEEMRKLRVRSFGHEPSRATVTARLRPYFLHHAVLHLGYRLGLIRY